MHDYRKFKVSVNGRIGRTARLSERLRRYVTQIPPHRQRGGEQRLNVADMASLLQAESSPEYQMLLEALQRELKFKAYRKGATAIVSFSVQLQQLQMLMHYRVLVTGSAVKTRGQ